MNPPFILFPHQPSSPEKIDSEFTAEFEAAQIIGFHTALYNHQSLETGDATAALHQLIETNSQQRVILRGWMLPGEAYHDLYTSLVAKGYAPQTSPQDYEQAHYIPYAYPLTEGHTPKTEWIEGDDIEATWKMYQNFSHADAIIKDWVKSAKRQWKEGCYIPAHTDENRFREIYQVFRKVRSRLFNRGVVLREFMPIVERGGDLHSLPVIEETRLFFWKGEIIIRPDARAPSPIDELDRWEMIAKRFSSPFITIDVAYLTDGTWRIVEVGDAGVSGLPMGLAPEPFYASLWNHTNIS